MSHHLDVVTPQDGRGLLDRASGPGEALLVDRELVTARVDAVAQPREREVGELFGDGLEAHADVVELTSHRRSGRCGTPARPRPYPQPRRYGARRCLHDLPHGPSVVGCPSSTRTNTPTSGSSTSTSSPARGRASTGGAVRAY